MMMGDSDGTMFDGSDATIFRDGPGEVKRGLELRRNCDLGR